MKNYIWILLCGLTGLSGFWIGRKSVEVKYRKMLREEVQGLKKYYRNQAREKEREYREKFEELGFARYFRGDKKFCSADLSINPLKPMGGDFDRESLDETPGGVQRKMVTDMQTIVDRYQEQDFADMDRDQAEEEYPAEDSDVESEKQDYPYVITEEEFSNERNWYSKLQYEFYQGDQALVNECDEIVLNWEDEIGVDAMVILLETSVSEGAGEVFVRNDTDGIDYDILVFPSKASDKEFMPRNEENYEEFAITGGGKS